MRTHGAKRVLILCYTEMPSDCKKIIEDYLCFGNNRYLEFQSEFSPEDDQIWRDSLNKAELNNYYEDQKEQNLFSGSYEKFVLDYELQIEEWIIESEFDLDVDKILIEISW